MFAKEVAMEIIKEPTIQEDSMCCGPMSLIS